MSRAVTATSVPYLDLDAQYQSIRHELHTAIDEVFATGTYVLGSSVERFERDFATFCGNAYCVGVNNGTAALHLALVALGVGPGDEVITQANTFIATVAAILYTGARPVLVDVCAPSYSIDTAAIENAITPRTKAILPVHLFGQPCDLSTIRSIANRHGLAVVEDASQAHGAIYRSERVGAGDVVTFSFYPGKNLGAAGEAGAIVVRDERVARRLRILRNHGSEEKHRHVAVGFNYRLESLQGAILGVKLRYLDAWTAARRRIAARYDELLDNVELVTPLAGTSSACHIYPVLVDGRDALTTRMRRRGVETNIHYPIPCHLQPGYAHLGYRPGDFPQTERLARRELSLPIFPELRDDQVAFVAESLQSERC